MINSFQRNVTLKQLARLFNSKIIFTLPPKSTKSSIVPVKLNCFPHRLLLPVNSPNGKNYTNSMSTIFYRLYSTEHSHPNHQPHKLNNSLSWLQPDKNIMQFVDELIEFREQRTWSTVIKVLVIMFVGVNFGAWLAKVGVRLLEKYEIYVRDDDDSDD